MLSSEDIIFSPRTERKLRVDTAQRKRAETMAYNRAKVAEELAKVADEEAKKRVAEEEMVEAEKEKNWENHRMEREKVFDSLLDSLQKHKYTMAEFLDYVFNPELSHIVDCQWEGFFKHREVVERILGYWVSSGYSKTTRMIVTEWMKKEMMKVVAEEAKMITKSQIVRKSNMVVNEDFFLSYSLVNLTQRLRALAPNMFALCDAFSTTTRQMRSMSGKWFKKKELVSSSCLQEVEAQTH